MMQFCFYFTQMPSFNSLIFSRKICMVRKIICCGCIVSLHSTVKINVPSLRAVSGHANMQLFVKHVLVAGRNRLQWECNAFKVKMDEMLSKHKQRSQTPKKS